MIGFNGFRRNKGGEKEFNGVLLPSDKIRFSAMYEGSEASISCTKTSLIKTGTSATGASVWGNIGTIDAYDFTNYTKLSFTFTISNYQADDVVVVGYATSRYSGFDVYYHMVAHSDRRNNGTYTLEFNIANQTGPYYVVVGGGKLNYTVSSIVLS